MVVWWLCWHRTILIRNITQKQYSQFPPVHDFRKPWWGVAYVPCMTNLLASYAWLILWHVTCMLSLAGHWQGWRALSNHVCAHSVISLWHDGMGSLPYLYCAKYVISILHEWDTLPQFIETNICIQMCSYVSTQTLVIAIFLLFCSGGCRNIVLWCLFWYHLSKFVTGIYSMAIIVMLQALISYIRTVFIVFLLPADVLALL